MEERKKILQKYRGKIGEEKRWSVWFNITGLILKFFSYLKKIKNYKLKLLT